jgi:hypothetical protein
VVSSINVSDEFKNNSLYKNLPGEPAEINMIDRTKSNVILSSLFINKINSIGLPVAVS